MTNCGTIKKKENVFFSCGVEFNGKLYIASSQNNELFEYDCKTEQLRYITCFEKEKDVAYLYRIAIIYKEEAWFIPQLADNIAIVNLNTFKINYIPLNYKWLDDPVTLKCTAAGIYKEHYLYIIPYDIDSVMLIDMDTKNIRVLDIMKNHNEKYCDAYYYNDYLYCIPWMAEDILKINVETGETQQLEWKFGKKQYSQTVVDYEKAEVWFTPAGAINIVKLDLVKNEWFSFPFLKSIENDIENYYGEIIGNKVFMFPFCSKKITAVNKNDLSICSYEYETETNVVPFFKPLYGNKFYFVIEYTNDLLYYNEGKNCFESKKLDLNIDYAFKKMRYKKMQNQIAEDNVVKETGIIGLRHYIKNVLEE